MNEKKVWEKGIKISEKYVLNQLSDTQKVDVNNAKKMCILLLLKNLSRLLPKNESNHLKNILNIMINLLLHVNLTIKKSHFRKFIYTKYFARKLVFWYACGRACSYVKNNLI